MRPAPLAIVALLALAACAPLGAPVRGTEPLRLSELLDEGDAERRSSQALVVQGLEADADARPDEALGDYLSALRVDPGNPWAYLALARQQVDQQQQRPHQRVLEQVLQPLHAALRWAMKSASSPTVPIRTSSCGSNSMPNSCWMS